MPTTVDSSESEQSVNLVIVRGKVATDVRVSNLPKGGVVHNFEVTTGERELRHVVPVAWHDPVRPPRLAPGDAVVVTGVVRRRWFRAGGTSQSRTEILAATVAKARSRRAANAVHHAVSRLPPDLLREG